MEKGRRYSQREREEIERNRDRQTERESLTWTDREIERQTGPRRTDRDRQTK